MQDRAALETFIKSSSYTSPQYIKRLKFIFSAICHYAQSKNKSIEELEILEFGCGTGGSTFPLTSLGPLFGKADVWLADILPWWLASGWYFVSEAE